MCTTSEKSCLAKFPDFTHVKRIVPKESFYDKINYATKMLFQHEIARITWECKLAPDTINLPAKTWPEIEVFQIELKNHEIPPKILKTIDSAIPYPILFIITKGTAEKAVISYKEPNQKNEHIAKVYTYFSTGWNDSKLDHIKIDGLDLDTVFSNFIRQIAGERLAHADSISFVKPTTDSQVVTQPGDAISSTESHSVIQADIARMKAREKIQKQINILDRRIKSEPSIGKKQKLAEERYKLLQELRINRQV